MELRKVKESVQSHRESNKYNFVMFVDSKSNTFFPLHYHTYHLETRIWNLKITYPSWSPESTNTSPNICWMPGTYLSLFQMLSQYSLKSYQNSLGGILLSLLYTWRKRDLEIKQYTHTTSSGSGKVSNLQSLAQVSIFPINMRVLVLLRKSCCQQMI